MFGFGYLLKFFLIVSAIMKLDLKSIKRQADRLKQQREMEKKRRSSQNGYQRESRRVAGLITL